MSRKQLGLYKWLKQKIKTTKKQKKNHPPKNKNKKPDKRKKNFCFSELFIRFFPIEQTFFLLMPLSFECPLSGFAAIMYSVLKSPASLSCSPEAGEPVEREGGGKLDSTSHQQRGRARLLLVQHPVNGAGLRAAPRPAGVFPRRALRRRAEMLSTGGRGTFLLLCSAKPPAFYKHIKH